MTEDSPTPQPPYLRLVRGDASPEQVAALVAVLTSLDREAERSPGGVSPWSAPRRHLRTTLPHGPGAWRASALPR